MNTDTLEFFFGPVTHEDFSDDAESYFVDEAGKLYYYKIVMDEDQFYIYDTCNRMMPVDRGFIRSMNTAMFAVTQMYQAYDDAQSMFERKYTETMQLVDFWNQEGQQ